MLLTVCSAGLTRVWRRRGGRGMARGRSFIPMMLMLPVAASSFKRPAAFTPASQAAAQRSWGRLRPRGYLPRGLTTRAAKKVAEDPNDPANLYRDTVALPQTGFDQRANSPVTEPKIQSFWDQQRVYERLLDQSTGPPFVLHDGPPYANGDLHIGHALNKILKDFINRYKMLKGYKVKYVPGWDCHGLPIELKVLQSLKQSERQQLTPVTLRQRAALFAKETVERQRKSFKRYGVWGDWEQPYLTLQPEYEAAQIRVFGDMVFKGHIYRGRKPVHWSPSSRTALAEAELEYPENHISKSIYVGFAVEDVKDSPAFEKLASHMGKLYVAIWTTTPWTIPANLAVAVNGALEYALVTHDSLNGAVYVVAKDLVEALGRKVFMLEEGQKLEVLDVVKGKDLVGVTYRHPIFDRVSPVLEGGDYITTESGTGLVHTAPGHGQEDYITGMKNGLQLLSPVDDAGRFTEEAGERLQAKDVLTDGNVEVINALNETGSLLLMEPYNHKYPYDWRTKKPTIFRATDQWFASVDSFRQEALDAIDTVTWMPEGGKRRISTMTESRSDWCISRQRAWGVPIPVFYRSNGSFLMNQRTIQHIESVFREHGSDAWWTWDVADLLPEEYRAEAADLSKGSDTMDVWFDSGSSWAGVLKTRSGVAGLTYPADVYLEGSDQHRGWFQSSLLTSVAATGKAPYKTVLTHGFVLDEKGYKMSKSLGNVVDPMVVIEGGSNKKQQPPFGADVLRLWVSFVDYSNDVCVGQNILKQISEAYRKLRNTARYLVGNLYDYNPAEDAVAYDSLPRLDKWILGRLAEVIKEVEEAYEQYQFNRASQVLQRFAVTDLSSFYLDVAKDRLYIAAPEDFRRRSCQTTMHIIVESLTKAMAPLLPHMAEDIWQNLPYKTPFASVFESGWVDSSVVNCPAFESEEWALLLKLRDDVNKCMEAARREGVIGASQEAAVYIAAPQGQRLRPLLESLAGDSTLRDPPVQGNAVDDLRFLLLASQVHVVSSAAELEKECGATLSLTTDTESGAVVGVRRATGQKCARCWFFCETVNTDSELPHICPRCAGAVRAIRRRAQSSVNQPVGA